MKTDSENKAESFWDRTASNYDKEEKKDDKTLLQIIEKSKAYLKPIDTVLDFGCGTGRFTFELSGTVNNILAIDFSSKMIEIAKKKAENQKPQNIEFVQATIFDERLKLGYYDVVMCFYILHLLEDPKEAISRIYKLLKPGGILIAVTPCMGEKPFLSGLVSILGRIGIVPRIKSFKLNDLVDLLSNEYLKMVENKILPETSNQYFMVVKK